LLGIGDLSSNVFLQWPIRAALLLSALLFAVPGGDFTGYSNLQLALAGAVVLAPAAFLGWLANRSKAVTAY
jgi:membrane protease YdiL (CAAX protease family)